jgi:hypothetical protein
MRENGVIVDSVLKKDAARNLGTQAITIDNDIMIPLVVWGGLKKFLFREPTQHDYDTYRIVERTTSEEEFTGVSHVRMPRRNAT